MSDRPMDILTKKDVQHASTSPPKLSPAGIRRSIDAVEGGAVDSSELTWKKIKLDTEENDNDSIASDSDRVDNDEDDDGGDSDDEDDDDSSSDNDSEFSSFTGLSELSGQQWKPKMKPSAWIQKQMHSGANPRELLSQILSTGAVISQDLSDMTLWRILANMLSEPPKRHKLRNINTIEDVVQLLHTCQNIMVLTGAGVSVSCGIPDFRSSDGIYSRLAKDFPGLPDPQAMFDINYFHRDPRPFFKFAREIYPGQFKPSTCHRFIKMLETKGKLLRNYTQNIDTLEKVAGIRNVIECHGSFATASCTKCKHKTTADTIRADIFAQRIPMCPKCKEEVVEGLTHAAGSSPMDGGGGEWTEYSCLVDRGIMKPDIVFFGEGLPETFHSSIARDKDKCDLLIVIGSSLKVHPVALIPRSISPDVPQILINRERLGNFEFDVELLGDSDTIITQLSNLLGEEYTQLSADAALLNETRQLKPRISSTTVSNMGRKSPASTSVVDGDNDEEDILSGNEDTTTTDSQSLKSSIGHLVSSSSSFCDSGFESTSSSSNIGNLTTTTATALNPNSNMISNISDSLCNGRKYYHKNHHYHRSSASAAHLKRRKEHSSSSESESPPAFSTSPDSLFNRLGGSGSYEPRSSEPIPDVLKNEKASIDRTANIPASKQIEEVVGDDEGEGGGGVGCSSRGGEWRTITMDCVRETSIADQLYSGTYYKHCKNGIYVFSGAQVHLTPELELSSCDSEDDDDYEEDNQHKMDDDSTIEGASSVIIDPDPCTITAVDQS